MNHCLDAIRAACTAQAVISTPLGTMRLARGAAGLAGAWFEGQKHHPGVLAAPLRPDDALLAHAARQLRARLGGVHDETELPLDLLGTDFQRAVWQALRRIPAGSTCGYADIARAIGRPAAVRAVGAAVGRNPLSVLVPCHRVIGSDGSLTGYAGGIERKRALLALEAEAVRFGRVAA